MTNYEAQQKIIENNEIIALYDLTNLTQLESEMINAIEDENIQCAKVLESAGIFAI